MCACVVFAVLLSLVLRSFYTSIFDHMQCAIMERKAKGILACNLVQVTQQTHRTNDTTDTDNTTDTDDTTDTKDRHKGQTHRTDDTTDTDDTIDT